MTKDRRLGKGLAALLGTVEEEGAVNQGNGSGGSTAGARGSATAGPRLYDPDGLTSSESGTDHEAETSGRILDLSVYEIDNNPFQPRRQFNQDEIASLAESLKTHEQIQPVLVRRDGDRYQLISGERRLRAAIHAGLSTVRAEVRDADDRLVAELAIIENLQRKDLNAVEKAMSFRRYVDEHQCTQEELASRLKIDRSTVANLMRLLELPDPVLNGIQSNTITAGHARAMLPLGDEDEQCKLAQTIADERWSVRQTESYVSELIQAEEDAENGRSSAGRKPKKPRSSQISALEQKLRLELGTKVEIKQAESGKGKIVVHFANPEEFERVADLISTHEQFSRAAA